jgi:hypothetical protein
MAEYKLGSMEDAAGEPAFCCALTGGCACAAAKAARAATRKKRLERGKFVLREMEIVSPLKAGEVEARLVQARPIVG